MANREQLLRLQGIEGHLRAHLRGQDHVLPRLAAVFVRGELGLTRTDRPRGIFLSVGPTGTGKTESVLLVGQYLFGENLVRRFDLSEYQRPDAIERLLGADGSEGGAIGRAAHGAERRIWLFDELEKAHPKVFDLFIQMLEPGHLTLATGQVVSFRNDYIAFTSNLGAAEAMRMVRSSLTSIERAVLRRVAESLRPEILARIPDKFVFGRLTPEVQREIAALHLAAEVNRLRSVGFDLEVSREVLEFLMREGFHPHLGARPLRQTIEHNLQDAVAEALFSYGIESGKISVNQQGRRLRLIPS
ncbi:AAA family ATPase [Termitidicoccus mucosus]|uniref:Clp ATPase C-terminal domain-containing protein n=1 Tax=Termitidicoccus mucosus TaxID=1184151 RepID=A0A178IBB6_9BACT|nr:hypothetical protein AW736_24060 [Opitutaceae bacterium TSB47]